jgi:integrase
MAKGTNGSGHVTPTAAADGRYRGFVTIDGTRKWVSAPTRAGAAQKVRDLINRAEQGTVTTGASPTLTDWMHHWLTIADLKPLVKRNHQYAIDRYIAPTIGKTKLDQLKPEHIEVLYTRMASGELSQNGQPLSPRTIGNLHSIIRRSLNIALRRGKVGRNVALIVEPPRKQKPSTESFSPETAQQILAAASGDRLEARWHLALLFGLRPGEATALGWADVDTSRNQITVRRQLQRVTGMGLILTPPKTASGSRTITIPPHLTALLEETRQQQMRDRIEHGPEYTEWSFEGEPAALVFTQPTGMPVERSYDQRHWVHLLERAGVPHARLYQARHTAASLLISFGMEISAVSHILGHSKTSFTYDTYVHPMSAEKDRAADLMGAFATKKPIPGNLPGNL